jgi:hypothetical protein
VFAAADGTELPANRIQAARVARTQLFFNDRQGFLARLTREIAAHVRRAERLGLRPAVRFQFYDYTASVERATARNLPANYSLTFSRKEGRDADALRVLRANGTAAVVFRGHDLPAAWGGFPVVDGRIHDLRFLDPRGVVVGLSALGRARYDASGFVVDADGADLAAADSLLPIAAPARRRQRDGRHDDDLEHLRRGGGD